VRQYCRMLTSNRISTKLLQGVSIAALILADYNYNWWRSLTAFAPARTVPKGGVVVEPQDWLVLYLSLPADTSGQHRPGEPVRIMKGMFLFAQECAPAGEAYEFVPYNYGPCSFEIYRDLEQLISNGEVVTERPLGQSWVRYMLTPLGQARAHGIRRQISGDLVEKLAEIKTWVCSLPFIQLLREVYAKYPDFAVNSIIAH